MVRLFIVIALGAVILSCQPPDTITLDEAVNTERLHVISHYQADSVIEFTRIRASDTECDVIWYVLQGAAEWKHYSVFYQSDGWYCWNSARE